jgi:hypothetical protein
MTLTPDQLTIDENTRADGRGRGLMVAQPTVPKEP